MTGPRRPSSMDDTVQVGRANCPSRSLEELRQSSSSVQMGSCTQALFLAHRTSPLAPGKSSPASQQGERQLQLTITYLAECHTRQT